MVWSLIAISGMLAAEASAAAPASAPAAIEITFVTHAGEGAAGQRRILRNGCYQVESGGSTGGAGYARESQAGCHRAADVAAVFTRLGAVGGKALVRETAAAGGGEGRSAHAGGLRPDAAETRVVIVRADGSRWVAADASTADEILRAVNELPSENQWYAQPPTAASGGGAQLVVLSVATPGRDESVRVEASLASDGRWWCHHSVTGPRHGSEPSLPPRKPSPISGAPARLRRILEGASPAPANIEQRTRPPGPDGREILVSVAWPGGIRDVLFPSTLAATVVRRFDAEMAALSSACDVK